MGSPLQRGEECDWERRPRVSNRQSAIGNELTVKLTADWGTDYMHLAKMDGKWMIVNELWQIPPPKK
jgi:hypothetical protein